MVKQSVKTAQSPLFLKSQNHILWLGGLGTLIPLTILSTGIVLAESSSDSANSSNSLEPMQASKKTLQEPKTPNYESVPDLELEETEPSPNSESNQKPTPPDTTSTTETDSQNRSQKSNATSSETPAKVETKPDSEPSKALQGSPSQEPSKKAQDKPTSENSQPKAKNHSAEESSSPSVTVEFREHNQQQDSVQKPSTEKLQQESEDKKQLEAIEPLDTASSDSGEGSDQQPSSQSSQRVKPKQSEPSSSASTQQSSTSDVQEFSAPKVESEQKTPSSQKTATDDFVDNQGAPISGDKSLPAPQAPKVEVTDRAEGCTTVVEGGEMRQKNCQPSQQNAPSQPEVAQQQSLPEVPHNIEPPSQPQQDIEQATPVQKREVKNRYTPPEQAPEIERDKHLNVLSPLPQQTNLSSNFGWRKHPISGDRHFHTGVDFVAAEGTPVIATRSGQVEIASYQGGYGVMVQLNHDDSPSKSRYAHLSTTHVKPGEWVEQGTVIGQVGSTGYSSGPHLHFEWRIYKNGRWVAVDPKPSLFTARDEMTSGAMAFKENHNPDNDIQGYVQRRNWFNSLSIMMTSLSSQPAQWASLPELPFINQSNFDQLHQRSTQLSWFSQHHDSVLGLSYSLPQAFASLLNWEPPQLFDSPKEKQLYQTNIDPASAVSPSERFNQSLSNRPNANQVSSQPNRSLNSHALTAQSTKLVKNEE